MAVNVVTTPLHAVTVAVAEPAAPRLGPKFDDNEPYHRRRSTRLKSVRTPSPGHEQSSKQANKHRSRNYQVRHDLSPPSSPITPDLSLLKRKSKRDGQRMEQGSVNQRALLNEGAQMLPTPVKTPAKKDIKRVVKSTSRIVFPNDISNNVNDIMPKRSRISAYSPGSAPEVHVYTDASAQTPEVDESDQNVFYDPPHKKNARAKARSKAMEATEEKREKLEQNNHDREKGMWFTFRGKKIWKEYQDDDQDDSEPPDTANDTTLKRRATPPPRFVKTAYKPRTLFPEANKKGDTTDEEAVTDIEHPEKYDIPFAGKVSTPAKQRFYATPPTTIRTTRSTARRPIDSEDVDELSTSLFTVKKAGRNNHFDEWSRGKSDSGDSQEKKRKADVGLSPDKPKRAKGDVSG